ncbi:hypothetical protein F2Q70_00013310 [Brassica cretica]|uniref:Uncharacterized protein n=1 Tax=Brassica cretica TaxID=69181 RepID=A0A8S9M0S1_BRACR|nr:hypothetical protein F2Q70_00013310 [Brassica cretica]
MWIRISDNDASAFISDFSALPSITDETLLPMVEETESAEESSTQEFDGF